MTKYFFMVDASKINLQSIYQLKAELLIFIQEFGYQVSRHGIKNLGIEYAGIELWNYVVILDSKKNDSGQKKCAISTCSFDHIILSSADKLQKKTHDSRPPHYPPLRKRDIHLL